MALKLMIPGPIEVEDAVLQEMGAPVVAHYGAAWTPIHYETIDLLKQVFATTGKVFMMPGSGSLAADAIIHSLFSPGDKVLIGVAGYFGRRWHEILLANGQTPVLIECAVDAQLDPAQFEQALVADPSIKGIVAVQLETSTGVLHPIKPIADLARQYNKLFVVDGVSSLACMPLPMDEWGIDAVASASQKGVGGPPGLGLVALGARAWEAILQQPERPRSWFLDLRRWQKAIEASPDHPFPATMPTPTIRGVHAALQSLLHTGLPARWAHYEHISRKLRDGLSDLDLALFAPESSLSKVLTPVVAPPGVAAQDICDFIAQNYQIKISTGFGTPDKEIIRIGHMGAMIHDADIDRILDALRAFLQQQPVIHAGLEHAS